MGWYPFSTLCRSGCCDPPISVDRQVQVAIPAANQDICEGSPTVCDDVAGQTFVLDWLMDPNPNQSDWHCWWQYRFDPILICQAETPFVVQVDFKFINLYYLRQPAKFRLDLYGSGYANPAIPYVGTWIGTATQPNPCEKDKVHTLTYNSPGFHLTCWSASSAGDVTVTML